MLNRAIRKGHDYSSKDSPKVPQDSPEEKWVMIGLQFKVLGGGCLKEKL